MIASPARVAASTRAAGGLWAADDEEDHGREEEEHQQDPDHDCRAAEGGPVHGRSCTRMPTPETATTMRLGKYLARCGVASRRAAERLVAAGRVAVGGETVADPAHPVEPGVRVTVDGEPVGLEEPEVWAVNKPAGVVSTAQDTHGRPTVTEFVRSASRLYPVGRLDADTTGLILLTNDGDLAERLTHPRYGVEKTYRARVEPAPVSEAALRTLREGVVLDDGPAAAARVRRLDGGWIEITISEGRKRQVRRMCEAVGHRVMSLERVAFGPLRLDRSAAGGGALASGDTRRLTAAEVERLRKAARWENPAP